jgi:glycosyltransferase involved in cell wall biosynthesis
VLTRHWTGNENSWSDYLQPNDSPPSNDTHPDYSVIYLPTAKSRLNILLEKNRILAKLFGNIYFFLLGLLGRFNTEVDAALAFRDFLGAHLQSNRYDAVIITGPPSNIFELISVVKTVAEVPVIADIRDLWHNMMLSTAYRPSLKQRIWNGLYAASYRKWLKDVDAVTVIVPAFVDELNKLTDKPMHVIYNGYEAGLFSKMHKIRQHRFVFSIIGNLYPEQDISILLSGLTAFLKDKNPGDVEVRCIGADALPEIGSLFRASIPGSFLTLTGRVSKAEALQETLNADVLAYAGWKGVRGIISTKIFDYIASGNFIVIAPGDGDVLDRLVKDCRCGVSVDNPEEFALALNQLYHEWMETGRVEVKSDIELVKYYSREKQAGMMAELLHDLIKGPSLKESASS